MKTWEIHNLLRNKVSFDSLCHFRPVYPLEAGCSQLYFFIGSVLTCHCTHAPSDLKGPARLGFRSLGSAFEGSGSSNCKPEP